MPEAPSDQLIPELQTRRDDFGAAKREARAIAGSLSDEQFNWKPRPDRWSVAECLNHLNVFGFLVLGNLRDAAEQAHSDGAYADEPFHYGLVSRWFIRMMEPNPKLKIPTVSSYEPDRNHFSRDLLLPRFEDLQDELIEVAEDVNGLDLAAITVTSPAVRLMRFPLGAWLAAIEAHERRHLVQARAVIGADGFPER